MPLKLRLIGLVRDNKDAHPSFFLGLSGHELRPHRPSHQAHQSYRSAHQTYRFQSLHIGLASVDHLAVDGRHQVLALRIAAEGVSAKAWMHHRGQGNGLGLHGGRWRRQLRIAASVTCGLRSRSSSGEIDYLNLTSVAGRSWIQCTAVVRTLRSAL
jgi:hypothetical protein